MWVIQHRANNREHPSKANALVRGLFQKNLNTRRKITHGDSPETPARTSYAAATAGHLRQGGYVLLPTFEVPHYDLLLPATTEAAAGTLLSLFGPAERNPYRRRR